MNLHSSKDSGAAFDIVSSSPSSRLDLAVLAAPLDATVSLDAKTSNGVAAADPKGEGRERQVESERIANGVARGRVAWSDEGLARGSVSVRSSNAPVTLEL
ncbi:hypothetical protein DFH07DRAFT_1054403 [Mycena maculata]|uniref:Uncharacterized protein n=1 Tax=Mycena maculata TaxID=230809 RepID=A0AAD7P2A5_9AGAR|nr:hypothetical protein DFH07DRAFT_1054403 [Mycena maculata]